MAIRGILFDKDGTLIDVDGTWVAIYRKMLSELFDTDVAGAEKIMVKAGYDPQTERFLPGSTLAGGTTRQLIDIWWPGLDEQAAAEKQRVLDVTYAPMIRSHLKPLMPLEPVLSELKTKSYRLGIATNDSHISACNHLEHLNIHAYFEAIIAADTVPVPKPSGHMVRKFANLTGLEPSEIALVGDNSHDIDEARNGGAGLAIAVLTGSASRNDIAHLADHTIDSVAELPALLRSL
jgi:phosphoglycolate phosphatase